MNIWDMYDLLRKIINKEEAITIYAKDKEEQSSFLTQLSHFFYTFIDEPYYDRDGETIEVLGCKIFVLVAKY